MPYRPPPAHPLPPRRRVDHRPPANHRGYDAAWRRVRNTYLRFNPLCERCTSAGRSTPADDVHHIQTIAEAPHLRLDLDNLESLCRACHNQHHHGQGNE